MRGWARGLVALACAVGAVVAPAKAAAQATAPQPEAGWAQAALDTQYDVAGDVGWTNMPWVGTHNSYNSSQQTGVALSSNDRNQQITNLKQLEAGARSLELDVHRFPDVKGGPLKVCHARGADQGHFGCTTEKELGPTLAEIVVWLDRPQNSQEVLLLYLEDHMGNAHGYNAAADVVRDQLGDRLFEPPPGGCTEVPASLTREEIQAAGKQVLIVSDCGPDNASGWHGVAFNWDSHVEDRPVDYEDFPSCGPDYDIPTYETLFVRYYEDRTALTNVVGPPTGVATPDDGITPPTAAAMARCGVDLIGLDLVSGNEDPRFVGLVWSWQVNRPRDSRRGQRECAVQRTGVAVDPALAFPGGAATRSAWFDNHCVSKRPTACRDAAGEWTILAKPRRWPRAERACERRELVVGTPRTGYEAQELDQAIAASPVRQAWLGVKREGDTWTPTDPPPAPPAP